MAQATEGVTHETGQKIFSLSINSIWMYKNLNNYKRMIKPFLMDQKFIAGLGNIYIDESLWKSCIHPKTTTNEINKKRSSILTNAIKNILNKAITLQGTTIINFAYSQIK